MTAELARDASHAPVLLDEAMAFLAPVSRGVYCDCTVGLGGHSAAILQRSSPDGRLIGIDRDQDALAQAGAHWPLLVTAPCSCTALRGDPLTLREHRHPIRRRLSGRSWSLIHATRPLPSRLFISPQWTARHMRMDQSPGRDGRRFFYAARTKKKSSGFCAISVRSALPARSLEHR